MKALIVQGGWQGHEPKQVSEILARALRERGFEVEVSNTLDAFRDEEALKQLDLIIPIWTMGEMTDKQWEAMDQAIQAGCGIAGVHGGMGDAFRGNLAFQMMVGGQFVDHPGGMMTYRVAVVDRTHPITAGMENFDYESEQYYMALKLLKVDSMLVRFPDEPHGIEIRPSHHMSVWMNVIGWFERYRK